MKLYVAAPMTGLPNHNIPAIRAATRTLQDMGHEVTSGVELCDQDGSSPNLTLRSGDAQWRSYLARDIAHVAGPDVQGVVALDGWQQSRGAQLEVHVARELGKPVYHLDPEGPFGEPTLRSTRENQQGTMDPLSALALDVAARDVEAIKNVHAALARHKRHGVAFSDAWKLAVDAALPRGEHVQRIALEATADAWKLAYEQTAAPQGKPVT